MLRIAIKDLAAQIDQQLARFLQRLDPMDVQIVAPREPERGGIDQRHR